MKKQFILPLVWLVCQTASLSASTVLLGNLSHYTNDTLSAGYIGSAASTSYGKAIGFTMGLTDFNLDSVSVRLSVLANAVPSVEIWAGDAGTQRITGTSALLTLTTPTISGTAFATDTFTAPTTFTLTAGSTYYLVVRETSGLGTVLWSYDAAATTDINNGVTNVNRRIGTSGQPLPQNWTGTSSINNWFEINVSAVPEPSALGLFGIGGVLLSLYRRRSVG